MYLHIEMTDDEILIELEEEAERNEEAYILWLQSDDTFDSE